MQFFDAHCHLQDERLRASLPQVMARAAAAGVGLLSCCGSSTGDWADVRRISRKYPGVLPSLGLHPWYIAGRPADWADRLRAELDAGASGIGEIGLDHAIEPRQDADQESVFLQQLRIARERSLPVTIHCRRAWGRLIELLEGFGCLPGGFVIHSYSGSHELVPRIVELGGYLSFSGSITRTSNTRGRRAITAVPADRLLLETDAPDIPPDTGAEPVEVNEPANLVHVVRAAAYLRGVPEGEIAAVTRRNAGALFRAEVL